MDDLDFSVKAGFSLADETINFGHRAISSETLFETSTILSLKFKDGAFENPSDFNFNAISRSGYLYLSFGKVLKVFGGEKFSEAIYEYSFDSNIICKSVFKTLLAVCTEDSVIKLFKLDKNNTLQPIFTDCFNQLSSPSNIFIDTNKEYDEEGVNIYVVFCDGSIYRVSIDQFQDEDEVKEIKTDISLLYNLNTKINLSMYYDPFIVINGAKFGIFNTDNLLSISGDSYDYKKIVLYRTKLLCLDVEGCMWKVHPLTLKRNCFDYDFKLNEIVVIEDRQILASTKPNEQGEMFLHLLNKSLEKIFSLPLTYQVFLVDIKFSVDELLIVSNVTNSNGKVNELRLQTVYEADPESRLIRLIKRQRLEEAEKFAKAYNLDDLLVLKAKAQFIVDKSESSTEDIDKLISLMDSIDDDYFNLQCCANVDFMCIEDVKKILIYACKISPKANDDKREDILDLQQNLADLLFKYETFTALSDLNNDLHEWNRFSQCNLLEEIKNYLQEYNINNAMIICGRLDFASINCLSEEYIQDILKFLHRMANDDCESFLPSLLLMTIKHLQSAMPLFCEWIKYKLLTLEQKADLTFLENGINLTQIILDLFQNDDTHSKFKLKSNCIEELNGILKGLHLLQKLRNDYGVYIKINKYFEGPKVFLNVLLEAYTKPDIYKDFIKNILFPFIIENDLDPDIIFEEKIYNLLNTDKNCMPSIENIFDNITCLDIKLRTVKYILTHCPVPWCHITRQIAHKILHNSHPLVKEIIEILDKEDYYKVVNNPDYLINESYLNNDREFRRVVNRIMYVNLSSMVPDIFHLCQTDDEYITAVVILVMNSTLKGNRTQALTVLNMIKPDLKNECLLQILDYIKNVLQSPFHSDKEKINILPDIYKGVCDDESLSKKYMEVNKMYFLKCIIKTNLLDGNIEELMEVIAENLNIDYSDFNSILGHSKTIALYLSKETDEILLRLCNAIKNYELLIKAGEYLYESGSSSMNLCLLTILLLQYLGIQAYNLNDETLPSLDIVESESNDKFINGLKLGQKLIAKALIHSDNNIQVYEIFRWINTCSHFIAPDSLELEINPNFYKPKIGMVSSTVLQTIQMCFQFFVNTLVSKNDLFTGDLSYFTYFSNKIDKEENLLSSEKLYNLSSALKLFIKEGHQFTAVSLLNTLLFSLGISNEANNLSTLNKLKSDCIPQLLKSVINCEILDYLLILILLKGGIHNLKKLLYHYLRQHKRDCGKLKGLSTISIYILNYYKEPLEDDLRISVITCKWWENLPQVHMHFAYDEFFKTDPDTRLRKLIHFKVMELNEIEAYCKDYGLNIDNYYNEYLKSLLIYYELDYEIKEDSNKKKTLVVKSDENVLYLKCKKLIHIMKNKSDVHAALINILKEVNFYHYEVFLTIYKLLGHHIKEQMMLLFLKNYQRVNKPSQREMEHWCTRFPNNQELHPLSEFRFPFISILFTDNIWSILRPEIDLDSYKKWFKVTNILDKRLTIDDICTYAIKQTISRGLLKEMPGCDWIPYQFLDDLLVKVDECVRHIENEEKAASVVYELMNSIPNGIDKVKAAAMGLEYAEKYKQNNSQFENVYIKVKNKYYLLSVYNILYKYNLVNKKYLSLISSPVTLIESLYNDEISEHTTVCNVKHSDINKAVDDLAVLFELDIQETRLELLNRWLKTTRDLTNALISFDSCSEQLETNLKRAVCLCKSGDQEYWERYLISIFGEDDFLVDDSRNLSFSANAARCFSIIVDEDRIVDLVQVTYIEFLNFVDKLELLRDLDILGFPLNIETLDGFVKKDLIKKLARIEKPLAVKCMGSVCTTYDIEENKYWQYILNKSMKFKMITDLKIFLNYLSNKSNKTFYINEWQFLIDNIFEKLKDVSEREQDKILVDNCLLVQSCPVLFNLNLDKIVKICLQVNKKEYAGLFLRYLSEEKRSKYEKIIFDKKTDFSKLRNKGLWGVSDLIKRRS